MRIFDIIVYSILTLGSGFLTYNFIITENIPYIIVGTVATTLWAFNVIIRLFHKRGNKR